MIRAFDSHYKDEQTAKTVCLEFEHWYDDKPMAVFTDYKTGIAPYEPGLFYKRELPCLIQLWQTLPVLPVEAIVVDGFTVLDDAGKPGLGMHLYEALDRTIPVIGVAKSFYHANEKSVRPLYRGESKKPLYISAVGIELNVAFANIASMHGQHRMPTLLQVLDTLTKEH